MQIARVFTRLVILDNCDYFICCRIRLSFGCRSVVIRLSFGVKTIQMFVRHFVRDDRLVTSTNSSVIIAHVRLCSHNCTSVLGTECVRNELSNREISCHTGKKYKSLVFSDILKLMALPFH